MKQIHISKGFVRVQAFQKKSAAGFTLLEILLVVAALAILAGIVIIAINPGKQLADTRNSQRRVDVNTILNASYQYALDNNGQLPTSIPSVATVADCSTTATAEACKTGGDCDSATNAEGIDFVDLSSLTSGGTYIVSVPTDPTGATTNGAGYHVATSVDTGGRLTVCAPDQEQGASISVTR
jgi:prepilin-type N-terminal cleavage/methylation domain-containing protein